MTNLNKSTVDTLERAGLPLAEVARIVANALAEDLGPKRLDVTSIATISEGQTGTADLVARGTGVLAGLAVAAATFDLAGRGALTFEPKAHDGEGVMRGDVIATVSGPIRAILTAERTALNLLCRMSGVATRTGAWCRALAGTRAVVLDTRKTTPGLRVLEKYAVRVGGGANKRMGLYDVAMVKDNHKLAVGGVGAAFRRVREAFPDVPVQVEVTSTTEAIEAVSAGARFLLCDNMTPDQLRDVVDAVGGMAELEATGGLTLDRAREYAATGVDYLSVGELTHSVPIVDIALDLRSGS